MTHALLGSLILWALCLVPAPTNCEPALIAGTDRHLAVLVPTKEAWSEGRASIGAIVLAVDDANTQALIGRGWGNLTYSLEEVNCDRSGAIAALTRMLEDGPVDAVIGPDCSAACESTAYLTAGRDIPQISYACGSMDLSDKTKFPTVRPSHASLPTRIAANMH
jgi:ABC-type branched-subunit amino acid transport system substrate-binding protein